MSKKGILYGMGNPLLDMAAVIDEEYLKKYDLLGNNAILAEDKHRPIYDELSGPNFNVTYSPGGATQNTIRVAQHFLNYPEATSFIGCIGQDSFGDKLKMSMEKEGIKTLYLVDDNKPTGVCAVLLTGGNRSLVTRLDAANEYKFEHLKQPNAWKLVTDASFYYIAGFFLTVSPESMIHIGKHAVMSNKCFCMNLSVPFLSQFFKDQMQSVLPFVDILFGNDAEYQAFAANFNLNTTDLATIATKIGAMPKKNSKRSRIVIITRGEKPVILHRDGETKEFDVDQIPDENVIDTNGAGDAFVGGFLADYVRKKDLPTCVKSGSQAAAMIVQVSGCTLPERT